MAQIIKHRRGSISQLKDVTAKVGELVMATGSINDLNGPFIFIGETENAAGGYRAVSKLYSGNAAPTITNVAYGTVLDGTPFYAASNKTLYILSSGGNTALDLTGNIEGNTISGVTINNLESTNVSASFFTGSFKGDGSNLVNIPASGVTGLNLSQIASGAYTASISDLGGFRVNTDTAITGNIYIGDNTDSQIYNDGALYVQDHNNGVTIQSNNYAELQSSNAWVWVENNSAYVEGGNYTQIYTDSGNVDVSSYDGGTLNLNSDGGEGDVNVLNGSNKININGNSNFTGSVNINGDTSVTGSLIVTEGAAFIDQGVVSQNSNVLLTSGSNLIVQNEGNVTVDYIQGNSQMWNYLALNGTGFGVSDVELASHGDISLWAEGGTVNVTGSLRVTGDIIFSGSINLGDYTGDTINFNGEVSSSILPQTGSSFDLGASGQTWGNIWADTAHFDNISLNTISFDGLTEGRVLFVGASGSLKDDSSFTFDSGSGYLAASIIHATNDGNGTNFKVGNDVWIGEVNQANTMMFKGVDNEYYTKVLLNNQSTNNYLEADYSDVKLSADNNLYLQSQNSSVRIDSYDGTIRLNRDSNNNVQIGGNTYIDSDRNLYTNLIYDNENNNNYLQLYGWNTNDGYWWESGNGSDTTLLNNENNNNLNILQTNNGDVNIDATGGSVNLHSNNGFNVTGSMVVSDGSGVFNSSLIADNSNLTLTNGSNLEVQDGGYLTVNGTGYFNDSVYVTGSTYSNQYRGLANNTNVLNMNGGAVGAPDVELASSGHISLWSEGGSIHLTGSVYSDHNKK